MCKETGEKHLKITFSTKWKTPSSHKEFYWVHRITIHKLTIILVCCWTTSLIFWMRIKPHKIACSTRHLFDKKDVLPQLLCKSMPPTLTLPNSTEWLSTSFWGILCLHGYLALFGSIAMACDWPFMIILHKNCKFNIKNGNRHVERVENITSDTCIPIFETLISVEESNCFGSRRYVCNSQGFC